MTDSHSTSPDEQPQAPQPYPAYSQTPGYAEAASAGPPPPPPSTVTLAARLLYVMAGIGVLATLLIFGFRSDIEDRIKEDNPTFTADKIDEEANFVIGTSIVIGLLFAGLYVLLGRKITQGRGWARIVATVLLGLAVLGGLSAGAQSLPAANVLLSLISGVIAVATLVLLWRRPTSEFISETTRRRYR